MKDQSKDGEAVNSISVLPKKRYPFAADLFGSVCYRLQHGKFKKDFNDLTRIDARLDICSASSFIKGAHHLVSDIFKGHVDREVNPLASPKLNVILQQQVHIVTCHQAITYLTFIHNLTKVMTLKTLGG